MRLNDRKEQFSYAYIHAIASASGLTITHPPRPIDSAGIDVTISCPEEIGNIKMPRIDVQVKCTAQHVLRSDRIVYDLPVKNYHDLRTLDSFVPQLFILVLVPHEPNDWVAITEDETLLKKCAYWLSLKGMPETNNNDTIQIQIPRSNLLSPNCLNEMMRRVAERKDI